jgi:hypothetical protein
LSNLFLTKFVRDLLGQHTDEKLRGCANEIAQSLELHATELFDQTGKKSLDGSYLWLQRAKAILALMLLEEWSPNEAMACLLADERVLSLIRDRHSASGRRPDQAIKKWQARLPAKFGRPLVEQYYREESKRLAEQIATALTRPEMKAKADWYLSQIDSRAIALDDERRNRAKSNPAT